MKTKSITQTPAPLAAIVLAALFAVALGWNVAAANTGEDTPAQAAARAALLQKMQQADTLTNQPASPNPAPPAPAPVAELPLPAPAPAATSPVNQPGTTNPPAASTLPPLPPASGSRPPVNPPPTTSAAVLAFGGSVNPPPTTSAAVLAFGGSVNPPMVVQPVSANADTDGWAGLVSPALPAAHPVSLNPGLSVLLPQFGNNATLEQNAPLEQHTRGKIIQDFHADNLDLRTALALFASQNNLNIVPDNNVVGTVTLDVHNLPLDQMMRALLEAGDCSWAEDGGLIRVRNTETRTFFLDYLRLKRNGTGTSSATLQPATSGGSGGSGGGSSGGGGGASGSTVTLTADNATDFWTELRTELGSLLTADGMKSLAINKTAGIIQITDRPSALNRVQGYLMATEQSINRQVDIETKIYDVSLNDSFQFGIDWDHVASAYEGSLGFGTATLPVAIGSGTGVANSSLSGLNTSPSSGIMSAANSLVFTNMNTSAAINALKTQGNVTVIAAPRIRTLNNQTAVVKVGQELPFFTSTSMNSPSQSGNLITTADTVTTVTIGTILSITPQISDDGWIAMDISPVLTGLVSVDTSPDGSTTAPVLDDKQASTIVRIRDSTTVVLGGLIQTEKDDNNTSVPLLGDIPLLGKLFTGTYHNKTKNELVIFVTPHIVQSSEGSAKYVDIPDNSKKTQPF